jgi:hypothetical protein
MPHPNAKFASAYDRSAQARIATATAYRLGGAASRQLSRV